MKQPLSKPLLYRLLMGIALLLLFSFPVGDADLGWHLRYGEALVNQHELIRDNQFSWLLPDYQWANHSWGFDLLLALLFNGHRFWLLSLAAGAIISLAILLRLPTKLTPAHILSIAIVIFFNSQLLNIGLRSQLISLLFTVLLWNQLEAITYQLKTKKVPQISMLAKIPLQFFLWANLHGQFILGIIILAIWSVSLAIKHSRFRPQLIGLCLTAFLATLINPFGFKLWQTTYDHLNAPELKYIYEWMPWEFNTPRMIALLILMAAVWVVIHKKKPLHTPILPLAALTILAITSRRIIPYWLIVIIPQIAQTITFFIQKMNIKLSQSLTIVGLIGLLMYSGFQFNHYHIANQSWDTYCQTQIMCSEAAVNWLAQNPPTGPLFNAYRLGGHLIYRLPEIKPMIDGRMTIWRDKQGNSAFLTYAQIIYGQSGGRDTLYRLNPEYVLIQPYYPLYNLLVKQEGWPIIYQDQVVVILQNPIYQRATPPTTN